MDNISTCSEYEDLSNSETFPQYINKLSIDFLDEITRLWHEIGTDAEDRNKHVLDIFSTLDNLYKENITKLNKEKTELVNENKKLFGSLESLKLELNIDIPYDNLQATTLLLIRDDLQQKLEKYQNMYDIRKIEITDLLNEEEELCAILGKPPKQMNLSPLPTQQEQHNFRIYLKELMKLKSTRTNMFLDKKLKIIAIMDELHVEPNVELERKVVNASDSDLPITDADMILLNDLYQNLENQLKLTKQTIADLKIDLVNLWDLFDESQQVRNNFWACHSGNNVDTMRAIKIEIKHYKEKKKANIKTFIDKLREQLSHMWDKCYYSPEKRDDFQFFANDCYTDDLLILHERELDRMRTHYEQAKPIYNMVAEYEELWLRKLDLDHRANQPNRFKNRGGQLLKEEKERKTVERKLPQIEHKLIELVKKYENKMGDSITINGKCVEEMIDRKWEEHEKNKRLELSAKKQAREMCTPMKSPKSLISLTPATLSVSPFKRRLVMKTPTPLKKLPLRLKTERTDKASVCNVPKIQVNGSTIKRNSLERVKRMQRKRKSKANRKQSFSSTCSDYNNFETDLEMKPACRSTLFQQNVKKNPSAKYTPACTPRKVLKTIPGTPY